LLLAGRHFIRLGTTFLFIFGHGWRDQKIKRLVFRSRWIEYISSIRKIRLEVELKRLVALVLLVMLVGSKVITVIVSVVDVVPRVSAFKFGVDLTTWLVHRESFRWRSSYPPRQKL
jgi:hypothetical protein